MLRYRTDKIDAVRSNHASRPERAATGLEVKVPPFIKEGDKVKVDTRTGEYIERAN
jgi:elongation factor P